MPTINGAADSPLVTLKPSTGFPSFRNATQANRMTTVPMMVSAAPKKRLNWLLFINLLFQVSLATALVPASGPLQAETASLLRVYSEQFPQ